MVRLRNGTPEHGGGNHLLLSLLIPFDQNNCRLHRHHRFCRLGPTHRSLPLAGGHGGVEVRGLGRRGGEEDGMKCERSRREEISAEVAELLRSPYSSAHRVRPFRYSAGESRPLARPPRRVGNRRSGCAFQ